MEKPPNNLDVLRRQIQRAEAQLIQSRTHAGSQDDDSEIGVLFAGNWHDSIPRRLIADEELAPVEKVTWMVIRSTIHSPQQPGATPRRADLARSINCSPPTVSTSQAMLRIMRWMVQCKPVRHQGRFVGNILLMSDEPLSLATVLELDDGYIEFLEATAKNGNRNSRMRKAAAERLKEVDTTRGDVQQPTELFKLSDRLLSMGIYRPVINGQLAVGEAEAPQESHQSKNFAPVTNSNPVHAPVKNQPKNTPKPPSPAPTGHQSKFFAPVENDQSKFFATAEMHQSKFFAPVSAPAECGVNPGEFGEKPTENHQSKNFSPVETPENHQSKFFASADKGGLGGSFVCSSSSSLENNNNSYLSISRKTTTTNSSNLDTTNPRTRDKTRGRSPTQVPNSVTPTPDGWPAGSETPEALRGRILDELIDEDPLIADFEDLNSLVSRHLPELAHPRLERFMQYLLRPRHGSIPQLARLLRPLEPASRSRVLFQLMGKTASDWGGWSKEPLSNAVGYLQSLIKAEARGSLKLDDFAIRLMRAVEQDIEPYIPMTVDREQEFRAHDPRQRDFFAGKPGGGIGENLG